MDIIFAIETAPLILTECAVAERLRRTPGINLHPTLFNTPLIYEDHGKNALEGIYHGYRKVALKAELPILLCAPTWRVDKPRIESSGFSSHIVRDAVRFTKKLQVQWQAPQSHIFAGALLAPKNDCYTPSAALSCQASEQYHRWQIEEMSDEGIDIIIAQTLPSVQEATGMAIALAKTATPYVISFVINRQGRVLDSTPLWDAIQMIDSTVMRQPIGYMVNCVYPTFVNADDQPPELFNRLIGIQANSSSKDHDALDGAVVLEQDPLADWAEGMLDLNRRGVKILGGCCGTDDNYLAVLTR